MSTFDIVTNRSLLESEMRSDLANALQNYSASVSNFQLLNIEFPDAFTSAISETQSSDIRSQTAALNNTKVQNDVNGQVLRAQTETGVLINNAQGQAQSIYQNADGQALAQAARLTQLGNSLVGLKTNLGLTNRALVAMQWVTSLDAKSSSGVVSVNIGTPTKIKCLADSTVQNC
eukprot:TRINITY_DN10916_c0_g1_i7.p1 TRINITY_DN10916_c0_g1~~TRINITY_DN10916_c0_g1_i7.p1  ORF type:complete len:175 (-),score=23.91 TRINITY_DN10916_c0_g1_i7:264-788(-)